MASPIAPMSQDERFRQLIEASPDGVFVADRDGRYTHVNAAGCRLLGYTQEELLGRSIVELVAPGELARQASLKRRLQQGASEVSEWRLLRKDGTFVPVEMSASALPDGQLFAFVRDATERVKMEAALRESEALFSGLFAVSAEAIVMVDDAQHIVMFNEGAATIFGYARDEIIGKPLEVLLPERFRAVHREHVTNFAQGRENARRMGARAGQIIGLRKSGEEFVADASISRLEIGGKSTLTVSLHDITEQTRLADEDRLLADLGHILIAAGSDHERILGDVARVIVQDLADWCALDLVRAAGVYRMKLVHKDPEKAAVCEALERTALDRTRPNPISQVLQSGEPVLMSDVTSAQLEAGALNAEHLRLLRVLDPTSLVVVPLIAREQAIGTLTMGSSSKSRRFGTRDVRMAERVASRLSLAVDNARLHQALEAAVRAREDVLGVVAHDLRNPLNAISLHARLLTRASPGAVDPEVGKSIARAATRMNRMIQDLLDVTRLEAGQLLAIRPSAVSTQAVVAEAIAHHVVRAGGRYEPSIEATGEPLIVWADHARLLQVLDNLLGNALKFARKTICVSTARKDGDVVFTVTDDGPGIPAADVPRLFDRFWQATKNDRRGAGLGLSIVKAIVDAHGGRLWVESELGKGTTISFALAAAPGAG